MDLDIKQYTYEAKHSFAVLLGFMGDTDTKCNLILLKWPDAMDALADDNVKLFKEEMGILMCQPVKLVAESLAEILLQYNVRDIDYVKQVNNLVELASDNPIEVKNGLIGICNQIILRLRALGIGHEYVKNTRGEQP